MTQYDYYGIRTKKNFLEKIVDSMLENEKIKLENQLPTLLRELNIDFVESSENVYKYSYKIDLDSYELDSKSKRRKHLKKIWKVLDRVSFIYFGTPEDVEIRSEDLNLVKLMQNEAALMYNETYSKKRKARKFRQDALKYSAIVGCGLSALGIIYAFSGYEEVNSSKTLMDSAETFGCLVVPIILSFGATLSLGAGIGQLNKAISVSSYNPEILRAISGGSYRSEY